MSSYSQPTPEVILLTTKLISLFILYISPKYMFFEPKYLKINSDQVYIYTSDI